MNIQNRRWIAWTAAAAAALACGPALAQGAVAPEYRWLTFAVFAAIIGVTMYVTYLAAKRVNSASDSYTAGGGGTGRPNGCSEKSPVTNL